MSGELWVPLVTPLTHAGEVCPSSVAALMESVRPYVQGFVAALSTGEGWRLSDRQWQDIVARVVDHADGMPVWAGALRADTESVITLTRRARSLGVDAVVVTAPFTARATDQQVYEHVRAVSGVGLPVVLYDETEFAGRAVGMDTLHKIMELPGVVAVKESRSDPDEALTVAKSVCVPVLLGREEHVTRGVDAAGAVVALANLEPQLCRGVLDRPDQLSRSRFDNACARLGLGADDWYRRIKVELSRRGQIATDRTVSRLGLVPGGREEARVFGEVNA